jgi:hypothetical protein
MHFFLLHVTNQAFAKHCDLKLEIRSYAQERKNGKKSVPGSLQLRNTESLEQTPDPEAFIQDRFASVGLKFIIVDNKHDSVSKFSSEEPATARTRSIPERVTFKKLN